MDLDDFKKRLTGDSPDRVAHSFITAEEVAAFSTPAAYRTFLVAAAAEFPAAEGIHVVGSGNWGYSLDPNNLFRPFSGASDLDVAIISTSLFNEAWERLRQFHRARYYRLPQAVRDDLRRNGENVYCGFIAPNWIPDHGHEFRYSFLQRLNRVTQATRAVNRMTALYFKNLTECVDYYTRSVRIARRELGYEL
jgi:hypothetical protein